MSLMFLVACIVCWYLSLWCSGYPTGLAGTAIPLLARMTRILDSYDALTMDRPYHEGVSGDEALQLLRRDSHVYDPDLLKEFCAMVGANNMLAAK